MSGILPEEQEGILVQELCLLMEGLSIRPLESGFKSIEMKEPFERMAFLY